MKPKPLPLGSGCYHPEDSNIDVKQHVELAWSPDTVHWHRIAEGTPFIGHTPSETECYGALPYDWGTITPAFITTQPLTFDEPSVGITADIWEGGSVRVEILDKMGSQCAVSKPIRTSVTNTQVEWDTRQSLANLSGNPIRLRFQFHNAKLYAFSL